jgi:hypothetical protein
MTSVMNSNGISLSIETKEFWPSGIDNYGAYDMYDIVGIQGTIKSTDASPYVCNVQGMNFKVYFYNDKTLEVTCPTIYNNTYVYYIKDPFLLISLP